MLIAHISDFHLTTDRLVQGRVDTAAALDAGIDRLLDLDPAPDIVVATGDMVSDGVAEEYRHLRAALDRLPMPVYVVQGNHDDTGAVRAAFADHGYLPAEGDFLNWVVEDHALRLIGLDTTLPGEIAGTLCRERLDWLDARLAEAPDRPTLILMHHPPFATGIGFMDRRPLTGAGEMEEIVARHPQVEKILCGHLHRQVQAVFGARPAMAASSLAFQMDLRLDPDAQSAFILEPPSFLLHLWRPGMGIVSHPCVVGAFDGPHAFSKPLPEQGAPQ